MSRQIALDIETTGLSAEDGSRLIELGCVELVNRKFTGNNLHLIFNPGCGSLEFLRDKPQFAEAADEILRYLQGAEIILHDAAFDVGFLNKELERLGKPALDTLVASITDTRVMAEALYPGQRNSLAALCERLNVDFFGRTMHGSLLDAQLLADVYLRLTRPGSAPAPRRFDPEIQSDPLYAQAVQAVRQSRQASTLFVQQRLKIGYNRAARLLQTMEQAGLVSGMNSDGKRKVLEICSR